MDEGSGPGVLAVKTGLRPSPSTSVIRPRARNGFRNRLFRLLPRRGTLVVQKRGTTARCVLLKKVFTSGV